MPLASNRNWAKQFLSFINSEKFQRIIPANNWMFPASLAKDKLPDAFKTLIDPAPVLLFDEAEVAKKRKAWVKEWLNAMSK